MSEFCRRDTLEGQNRDVGDNAKSLFVFEPAGTMRLSFLGEAVCLEHWEATGVDDNGETRKIIRFHLAFEYPVPRRAKTDEPPARGGREPARRRPRKLRAEAPAKPRASGKRASLEETLALLEKANASHHRLLLALERWLDREGWSEIQEIPSAIDLWARRPVDNVRLIFEAKTLNSKNEVSQTRSGLSQLLEYRFFFGSDEDELCLVCDSPLADSRIRFLESNGVLVLTWNGEDFRPCGSKAARAILGR
jgi:hypothetical protein